MRFDLRKLLGRKPEMVPIHLPLLSEAVNHRSNITPTFRGPDPKVSLVKRRDYGVVGRHAVMAKPLSLRLLKSFDDA